MDGMQLARYIRKTDQNMILLFITAFNDFISDGYDVSALNYLQKAVQPDRLWHELDKAALIHRRLEEESLVIRTADGFVRLPLHSILYIDMQNHYAAVHAHSGTRSTRMTIDEFLGILPCIFVCCHRSVIVNVLKINILRKNFAILSDETNLPISRSRYANVRTEYLKHFPAVLPYG
jgi:DNA-binding LytR/AlgR family response regulator